MSESGSNAESTGVSNAPFEGIFDVFIDPEAAEQALEIASNHPHLFTKMRDSPSHSVLYSSQPNGFDVAGDGSASSGEAAGDGSSVQEETFTGKEDCGQNEFQDEEVQNLDHFITYEEQDALKQERCRLEEAKQRQEDCGRQHQASQHLSADSLLQSDESKEETIAEVNMAPSTRSQVKQKRVRKRAPSPTPADSDEDNNPKRHFRERTVNQKYPYQSDKLRTKLANSKGRSVKEKEVDSAVLQQMQVSGPKATARNIAARKKPKQTSNASTRSSVDVTLVGSEASTSASSIAGPELSEEFIAQHTDFYVEVKGSEEKGAAVVSMQKASTLDKLIDFVESFDPDGESLSWIRCFLHWKVCERLPGCGTS